MENNCKAKGECGDKLCRFCQTKDKNLRDEIFEQYSYLAAFFAKKYSNKGVEYEDLYQVACLGVVVAIDRFDCSRGVKFSTFATPTILGEIKRYFRDKGTLIKLPRKLYEVFRKAERIRLAHEQKGFKAPTVEELATALKVADREVSESLQYADVLNMKSLEDTIYGDDTTLSQIIGVEEDSFLVVENHDFLCNGLRRLNPEEKKLIVERYYKNKTQKQVAEQLGVSQMQVSRMERKVLGKIKATYIDD